MFNLYSKMNKNDSNSRSTGHDRFCQARVNTRPKKRRALRQVRRTNSANEFDISTLTAANKRAIFSSHRSASSEQENGSDHSEHSEKSPLVSARLDSLAKLFFSRSMPETSSRDSVESSLSRPNLKYQYTALDSGNGISDRSPRERAARDRALSACQEWMSNSNGRYDIIAHLDEIGSRHNKNWFLINDTSVRTDRLLTLLPIPPDCVALEELPPSESPKGLLMELLGSLHHPYIYPILDLGFLHTETINYACLVTPFNPRGSLKDLIYKAQWNEPWNRKYTRKPTCLPLTQVQRLGRQILEALLFLKERGFPLHGHLHSGNVILQNGVARLSGLENGLLGINSRVNAIMWSRTTSDIENIDIICFGHLLYEMCVGYELNSSQPSLAVLEMDLDRYPQILEILLMIFDPPGGCYPTLEELVLCDVFRNIDLRELRGPCISTIKPSLSKSTINLLQAVKKRQTASLGGSFSEVSSPCTPPSTPRDRRVGTTDSFCSSDSESVLDEVVITSSSYDSHHYDILNSPIHFCDNSIQSDDNSSIITSTQYASVTSRAYEETNELNIQALNNISSTSLASASQTITQTGIATTTNNQLTTDICNYKNSKSRRLEYSLRCLKYGRSNPSQDSAFGSLTDGELSIASSSFRLSSFQSVTSPIDEGVEDIIVSTITTTENDTTANTSDTTTSLSINNSNELATATKINTSSIQITDSAISTPCRDGSPNNFYGYLSSNDDELRRSHFSLSLSPKRQYSESTSPSNYFQFDPPKIIVNDQNSIYTTSPSKKSSTIEVFSQKYRVSSFEDMSPRKKNLRNSSNKIAFRSLEEERRIDSAFIPITKRTNSENRVYNINNTEKYKKLTHTSFSHRINNSFNNSGNNIVGVGSGGSTGGVGGDVVNINTNGKSATGNGNSNSTCIRERHSMWKDSIFYRKIKIAKSNDSLLDSPLNTRLSPSPPSSASYTSKDNYELRTNNILNRGNSINEISLSSSLSLNIQQQQYHHNHQQQQNYQQQNHQQQQQQHNQKFFGFTNKRGHSEDLTTSTKQSSSSDNNFLKIDSNRKSRSERYLFNLSKLKQTSINDCYNSDNDENLLNNDNKKIYISSSVCSINQIPLSFNLNQSNLKNTTTTKTTKTANLQRSTKNLNINSDIMKLQKIEKKNVDNDDNNDIYDNTSEESLPLHHQDVCKIIGGMDDTVSNNEEKTPLLDSMEMSPIITPTDSDPPGL